MDPKRLGLVSYWPLIERVWTFLPINFIFRGYLSSRFLKGDSQIRFHVKMIYQDTYARSNGKRLEKWNWEGKEANHVCGINAQGDSVGHTSELPSWRNSQKLKYLCLCNQRSLIKVFPHRDVNSKTHSALPLNRPSRLWQSEGSPPTKRCRCWLLGVKSHQENIKWV